MQADTLDAQGNRCLYCGLEFGWPLYRRRYGVEILEVNWDHRIPYAYLQDNPADNWVAACHVCNAYKGSLIFPTLAGIRLHIIDKAHAHHHDPLPLWERDSPNLGALPPFAAVSVEHGSVAEHLARTRPAALRVRRYKAAQRRPVPIVDQSDMLDWAEKRWEK